MFSQGFLCLRLEGGIWALNTLNFFLETAGYDCRILNFSWLIVRRAGGGGDVRSKWSPFCLSKLVMVRCMLRRESRTMMKDLKIGRGCLEGCRYIFQVGRIEMDEEYFS